MQKLNPKIEFIAEYTARNDEIFEAVTQMFDALAMNIPMQSIIFSVEQESENTILRNRLQEIAEAKNIFYKYIKIEERGDFITQIAECALAFLQDISTAEKFSPLVQTPFTVLKSLMISFCPNDCTFTLSPQEMELYTSYDLTQSLTEVFTSIGRTAQKMQVPICFFIDEIQNMKQNQLDALIAALRRTNQLGYPIIIIGIHPLQICI